MSLLCIFNYRKKQNLKTLGNFNYFIFNLKLSILFIRIFIKLIMLVTRIQMVTFLISPKYCLKI